MKKAYILAFSNLVGTTEQLKGFLDAIPEVVYWRTEIANCFFLISESDARTLSAALRKFTDNGKFIITEVTSNKQGWLSPQSWYLLNNKEHKPTK